MIAKAVGADVAKINYVPFKGGGDSIAPSSAARHRGRVGLGEYAEHIKAGRMRALAVSGPTAEDGIKSLKEQGIDVVLGNWRGIFGAPGLTPAQRDQLVKLVQAATENAGVEGDAEQDGWSSWFLAGDQFKAFLDEDTRRVTAIMESLGLKK